MSTFGTPTFAEDFKKLMDVWDRLEAMILRDYPDLSEDERYEMASSIMSKKLGLDKPVTSSCSCDACEASGGCDDPNH